MMSQYVPRASPVWNVWVCAVVSLLIVIQPLLPRLNAIRLVPSSYQFATGAFPTKLCQPTMFATPVYRSTHTQPLLQLVSVIMPLPSDGGESSGTFQAKPAYTC